VTGQRRRTSPPAARLNALEQKYDAQFKVVFDAIRELMTPPVTTKRRIGFHP
jgi:hypothetical protein